MSKREVSLGGPHIDPAVMNPQALKYAQAAAQRKSSSPPPLYQTPVAGGPVPPIPHLDRQSQEGLTMADQATQALFPSPPPSPLFENAPTEHTMHRPGLSTQGLLPTDILPQQAKDDPQFQSGSGAMYASNQPSLAYKYGVIRNGKHLAPQQLQSGQSGLRPETLEGIKHIQALQDKAKKVEDSKVEAESASSAAGAAARVGNAPGDDNIKPISEEDREKVQKSLEKMDDFDFNTFREMMMKDILNNEEQRKIVEARLTPMDITDIIMHGRVFQTVPIIPGKYEPEFQSVSGEEDLALKRLIMLEQKSISAPDRYLLDKYSLMGVAAGVRSINKKPLPDHLDSNGNFSDELFLKKFTLVLKLPFHMLSSLGINFFWFDVRVRMLFQAQAIKNG